MARVSFQDEVPKARVNIRYKSTKDGKDEEVELPQRVVVLGDFSQNSEDYADVEVEDMKKISIDKTTFNDVMKDMNIGLKMTVDSELNEGKEIEAELEFKSIKDFSPDAIVEQVPELNDLMKLRGLLNDLKAKVITNKQFKKELEKILTNAQLTEKTKKELQNLCLSTTTQKDDEPSSGDS
jgi:type VI secretion system protein ImpB